MSIAPAPSAGGTERPTSSAPPLQGYYPPPGYYGGPAGPPQGAAYPPPPGYYAYPQPRTVLIYYPPEPVQRVIEPELTQSQERRKNRRQWLITTLAVIVGLVLIALIIYALVRASMKHGNHHNLKSDRKA